MAQVSKITLDWKGLPEFKRALEALGGNTVHAAAGALYREAQRIMTRSKDVFVPVDTGVLRGSGHVLLPEIVGAMITVTLGFGGAAAPYALSVHENPRAGHTGGWGPVRVEPHWVTIKGRPVLIGAQRRHWASTGGWKYLERPMREATAGMDSRLAADVKGFFG